jgi:hypothetical protein
MNPTANLAYSFAVRCNLHKKNEFLREEKNDKSGGTAG